MLGVTVSLYGRVVAAGYDGFMARPEGMVLRQHRRSLLRAAGGNVLEIGAGTGANVPYYTDAVAEIVMTEPEAAMARKLEGRFADVDLAVTLVQALAERLPFADDVFDYVVSTLVLCTVDDLARSLKEIRRVLEPDGRLLFLEHVRSDEPRLARWQDRLERIWVRLGHGCHCNRRTLEWIRNAGFCAQDVLRDGMRGTLPIVRPLVVGVGVAGGTPRSPSAERTGVTARLSQRARALSSARGGQSGR